MQTSPATEDRSMRIRVAGGLGVALIVVVAVAWLLRGQREPVAPPGPREILSFGLAKTSYLALVAINKGFFEAEGLDLQVKPYASGRLSADGMHAGEVDVGVSAVSSLSESLDRKDFKIICAVERYYGMYRILARGDLDIHTEADLRGKRIATQERTDGKGTAMEYYLVQHLLDHGLREDDVEIVFLPMNRLVPALIAGEVAAIATRDPYIGEGKQALGANAVEFSRRDACDLQMLMIARSAFVRDHPEAVRRFLEGLRRAAAFARSHPGEAMAIVAAEVGVEPSEIEKIWTGSQLEVFLSQELILDLEAFARWVIRKRFTTATEMPDYLDLIHVEALRDVDPGAVRISGL